MKMATDCQESEVGTLAKPRPGRGHGDQCKPGELLHALCASGVMLFSFPHLSVRGIMTNRHLSTGMLDFLP